MGLAASQARLLMLTARKDDIEGRMMSIANQRLSLSRQQADLSSQYSDALNGVTLSFDGDGDGSGQNLTYDALMGSSAYANADQYILTNGDTGQVLLDNKYLAKLGTSKTYGDATDLGSDAYDFAATMIGGVTKGDCAAALGTNASTAVPTNDGRGSTVITTDQVTVDNGGALFTTNYSDDDVREYLAKNIGSFALDSSSTASSHSTRAGTNNTTGTYLGSDSANVVNFADFEIHSRDEWAQIKTAISSFVGNICNDVGEAVTNTILNNMDDDSAAGYLDKAAAKAKKDTVSYYASKADNENYTGVGDAADAPGKAGGTTDLVVDNYGWGNIDQEFLDVNALIKVYLNYFDAACADLGDNGKLDSSVKPQSPSTASTPNTAALLASTLAPTILGWYGVPTGTTGTTGASANRGEYGGTSTENSTKDTTAKNIYTVTTATTTSTDGKESIKTVTIIGPDGKVVNTSVKKDDKTTYVPGTTFWRNGQQVTTADDDFFRNASTYLAEMATTINKTADLSARAKFYINIYNEVARYGWRSGGNNTEGLQNQILNSVVSVKKYGSNGFATVSASETNSPIEYVDANTTVAEAEYEADKDRLDFKEKELDIQMNNLDTERSAIVTELESVQKIIDKNIESSFKIFQA